jgi:3'(2'), 5'-bisphosphate nucleotidase
LHFIELERKFPTIPLVAEEDSAFLRSKSFSNRGNDGNNVLVDAIFHAVSDKINGHDEDLSTDDVLRAIDRGGTGTISFNEKPATYWVRVISYTCHDTIMVQDVIIPKSK